MYNKTVHEIRDMLRKKEVTALEITKGIINRINNVEPKIDAYITLDIEGALEAAKKVDKKIELGESISDVAGIPMAVKDNICTMGIRTTCASKMLEKYVPPYDATVISNLKNNGAVIIGKTNMDEFAMGSSTENSAFKKTKNPYNIKMVPGGSSGGSAAAVCAGEAYYSLGSDTGGSIRQPAAFCGLVGMKPTYGRVSRYGLIAFASSLDQIGTFTRDVEDCALVMNYISGKDYKDSTSADKPVENFTKYLNEDLSNFTIGIVKEYIEEGIHEDIKNKLLESIKVLRSNGAKIKEINLPMLKYALETYYIISSAEASSNLSRFDGIRYGYRAKKYKDITDLYIKSRSEGFGDEVKRRIMLGTYVLSSGYYDEYYKKALSLRSIIIEEFKNTFNSVDCIITPTSNSTAFNLGEKTDNPLSMYLSDMFTVPANIVGLPALSIPIGILNNLPIGMQLIGNYFDEGKLFNIAYAYEKLTGNNNLRPNI